MQRRIEVQRPGLARQLRIWRASWRDTLILLSEFRAALIVFILAVVGGGLLYEWIAGLVGEPVESLGAAMYTALSAVLLQSAADFPHHPALQVFHFVMPLIGIAILAQGLADFGILLFNRRARGKEWEMAVASTLHAHCILVGLGHLGYRIAQKLNEMGESVAVIELNPKADTFSAVQKLGIPVIQDDATRDSVLLAANVAEARTIILASQDDSMNLQIALKARHLNPRIQVVIRIFDEDFARALHEQFGFTALSATEMAAPVFAAAAAGADVTHPISVEGQQLSLARLTIKPGATLASKTVGYVEDNYHLNIILLRHDGQSEMHPTDSRPLSGGDTLAVIGGPDELNRLMHDCD
ncbi:MAG TPA: NAD-binding protein [Anaerolineales bacterium]|jgi:Trk K+ transport system NAD-binding subunit